MSSFVGHLYETNQGLFCIDPEDKYVSQTLVKNSCYGTDEIRRMTELIKPGSRVLLLGAHIGTICIPLSKMVKEIVAFEANTKTFRLLKTNLLLNGCTNVTAYNLAASDRNGTLEFVMNTINSGGSKRLPETRYPAYFYDDPSIVIVPCVALDDFIVGKVFDVIFMDIEGSEYFAMKGMKTLLSKANVLVTEFIPHHLSNVAGITVERFVENLQDFNTFVVPSLRKYTNNIDEFVKILTEMSEKNLEDEGIIIYKDFLNITFT